MYKSVRTCMLAWIRVRIKGNVYLPPTTTITLIFIRALYAICVMFICKHYTVFVLCRQHKHKKCLLSMYT